MAMLAVVAVVPVRLVQMQLDQPQQMPRLVTVALD